MEPNHDFISTAVRAQLLAAGVPAWKHTQEGLLGLFPRELNVGATALGAHDLAEVLGYRRRRMFLGPAGMDDHSRRV